MAYDLVKLRDDASDLSWYRIDTYILSPVLWSKYPDRVVLTWSEVKFGERYAACVPDDKIGVYTFFVCPEIANYPTLAYPLYVGMTAEQSFRKRYQQYLRESRKRKPRPLILKMLTSWPDNLYFYYAPIDDMDHSMIEQVERDLISALLPPFNHRFPAEIQLLRKLIFNG